MVNTLVFDLDNTLIDRNAAVEKFLQIWLGKFGNLTPEVIKTEMPFIMTKDNWGYLPREDFGKWLIEKYDAKQTVNDFLQLYFIEVPTFVVLEPLVESMLHQLKSKYKLILATNGASVTQRKKLEVTNLYTYFEPENIFVSHEVGWDKPDKKFFMHMFESLKVNPENMLMIGDDPWNDIFGANACGIKTVWIANDRTFDYSYVKPDFIIHKVEHLLTLLP